jgi:ABC-2 type transport system permease protein
MCRLNLQGAMEYRASFLLHASFMALNNAVFLGFWWIFFERFGDVEGWALEHVFEIFGVAALAFGLARVVFGNLPSLSTLIEEGRLDQALSQPKDPLLKLLAGRTSPASVGDLAFGVVLVVFFTRHGAAALPRLLVLASMGASVIVSCGVLIHSLAFLMGRARGVAGRLDEALLTFALYPEELFSGAVRTMLFTVLPAGFISYVPVRLLARPEPRELAAYAALCLVLLVVAHAVFSRGVRAYESGNQLVTNV